MGKSLRHVLYDFYSSSLIMLGEFIDESLASSNAGELRKAVAEFPFTG